MMSSNERCLSSNQCIGSDNLSNVFVTARQLITLPGSHLLAWTCLFNIDEFNNNQFNFILKGSSVSVRAVAKRKAEHVAGRLCIHWCYQMLVNQTPPLIYSDKHGCPIWPVPFKGSISHCNGKAVGVLTLDPHIQSLGLDIETLLDDKTTADIVSMVLSSEELSLYASAYKEKMLFSCYVTLIFSAKEAIYKALYPIVKHMFDFSAASVVAVSNTNIRFILHNHALPELVDMTPIDVSYRIEDNSVLCACVIENSFNRYVR